VKARGLFKASKPKEATVRATVTNRGKARVKRAILPAATDELRHNGSVPFLGDKASGIEK